MAVSWDATLEEVRDTVKTLFVEVVGLARSREFVVCDAAKPQLPYELRRSVAFQFTLQKRNFHGPLY